MAQPPAPPPPRYDPAASRAIDLFVNRDGPIAAFKAAVAGIPGGHSSILIFYGVSGQGKTLLCEKFQRILSEDASLGPIQWGGVDLSGKLEREPIYLLLWIREALARNGLRTTTFNFAYEIYRRSAERSHALPPIANGWLEAVTDESAGELGKAAAKEGGELIGDVVDSIPFVGGIAKRIGKRLARKGYEKWLIRFNEALKELYTDGALLPPTEIERALPRMLAHDLASWRQEHPETKFVVLIDEYESLLESGGASDLLRGTSIDAALRELVSTCKACLFVLFSRERLRWGEIDPAWAPCPA